MSLSLYKLPNSYVSMDLETTGLSARKDGILQIGAIKVIDGTIVDTFQTFVNSSSKITSESVAVNGITAEMVKDATSVSDALISFLEFSDGLPMLGHNSMQFDRSFIEAACARTLNATMPEKWFDTLEIGKELLGSKMTLAKLCDKAGVTNEKAHDALSDARATHECYQWLRERMLDYTTDARDFTDIAETGPLAGEIVCITGDHPALSRHELMKKICEGGGTPSNGVTLKVTVLVDFANGTTKKAEKAREYESRTGLKTMSGMEFCELLDLPLPTIETVSDDYSSLVRQKEKELEQAVLGRADEQDAAKQPESSTTALGCGVLLGVAIFVFIFFTFCSRL